VKLLLRGESSRFWIKTRVIGPNGPVFSSVLRSVKARKCVCAIVAVRCCFGGGLHGGTGRRAVGQVSIGVGATKHAVTGMTKAAALEYAKRGIRVNAVGPGPVETPLLAKGTEGDPHSYAAFVPMGRIRRPDEIADPVVFLLSDEARYVTGHTLPVDGGVCSQ
jgi:hypothetical protein